VHWATRERARDHNSPEELGRALLDAYVICRRLLLVAAETLDALSTRPSLLKKEIRTNAERRAFEDFLDDTVEASAAVLLAGIRLELGERFERPPAGRVFYPLPRRALIDALVQEEELGDSTLDMGWLVSYADASSNAGRVEYNLACFYASVAWRERHELPPGVRDELLDQSAHHLRLAFSGSSYRDLQVLGPWVEKDPSLRGLRELAPNSFREATSALNRVSTPEKEPKTPSLWRRLFGWVKGA
jgi:hypothetical protein